MFWVTLAWMHTLLGYPQLQYLIGMILSITALSPPLLGLALGLETGLYCDSSSIIPSRCCGSGGR